MAFRRLFISHSWKYSERYTSMVSLLDDHSTFTYSNYSVPEPKGFGNMTKKELEEEIKDQIRPVNCVVIIGGMWTSYSDWIQFEIDFAVQLGKPILGVKPRGNVIMPAAVTANADKIVNWNGSSIVSGILEVS